MALKLRNSIVFALFLALIVAVLDVQGILTSRSQDIRLTSILPNKAQVAKDCQPFADEAKEYTKRLPIPSGWTIYIVCDEASWDSLSRTWDLSSHTKTAFSVPTKKLTVLRGKIFLERINEGPEFTI